MRTGRGDVLVMFAGTVLIGLSGYLFLALIGHGRFDAAATAALSATYLLGNVLGPGVFIAVEQETSRVVSDAIARRLPTRRRTHQLAVIDAGLTATTLLVLVALAPLLLSRVLDDQVGLIIALAVAVVGSAVVYLIRGLTGGQRRFRRYAMTVLLDGAARIVGCLVLVAVGSTDPVAFGLALCAGPAVAALCTGRRSAPPGPIESGGVKAGRPAPVSAEPVEAPSVSPRSNADSVAPFLVGEATEPAGSNIASTGFGVLSRDVGLLLVASALAMVLANLAPVVVTGLLIDDPVTAAGFAGAVVLTRVPLLFMGPIQALLLPGMTAAAAAANYGALRATAARGLAVIAVLGLAATLGTWIFGRPVLALLFGADRDTTQSAALVLLTASAAVFMAVQLLQPALVALRLHRTLVLAWVVGAVVFGVCLVLPLTPVDRGVLAQIAGPVATLLVQLGALYVARMPPVPSPDARVR